MAFVALMLLRVAVGFHFFTEGTVKLRSGDFTAEYFLRSAKGPIAPMFQSMLSDEDGRVRLCLIEQPEQQGFLRFDVNPELTFALWDDFVDQAVSYYQFASRDIESQLVEQRAELAKQIQEARSKKDKSVDTESLEAERVQLERDIKRLRVQIEDAEQVLEAHQLELADWLNQNSVAIKAHFGTEDRLDGFDKDGDSRRLVARDVDSLREQVEKIRSDRQKELGQWKGAVESIWDSFEGQINGLAVGSQADMEPISLHRPFDQKTSKIKVVDRLIPWFDTIVGALLILGLFTRFASVAAAGFLISVIATQPPWIPDTVPTIYQTIELFAVIVIFATSAGRMGGLDFFFSNNSLINSNESHQDQA